MTRLRSLAGLKKGVVVAHDVVATALALVAAFVIRFDDPLLSERLQYMPAMLPVFCAWASVVYWFFGLYKSKWRFASLPDLSGIVKAATVLALTLLVADYALISPN